MTATNISIPAATDGESFEILPEGLYEFRLVGMENMGPGQAFDNEREPKDRIKWVFEIESVISGDDEAEERVGEQVWFFTSLSMHRKATMRAWCEGLLGREIAEGEAVDASDIIGKRGRANIVHYKKLTGDIGHKIASLLKPVSNKKRKPAPVVEDTDEDESFDEF